jgi:formate transporter
VIAFPVSLVVTTLERGCWSLKMDYAKPTDVIASMIEAGQKKLALGPRDLMIRGALSGALLGAATTLAFTGAVTTGQPLVGALIFPVGLVMIVLLGLELVTGSFALVPLARLEGKTTWSAVIANWSWVFVANLLGSVVVGALIAISLTNMGKVEVAGVAARIVTVAEAKTIGNEALGTAGMVSVFVKGILCNWLVCLGVVMAMTSTSTVGKITATWLPIFLFFALGYEHTVVNMFVIPTGMLLGAKVSLSDWWVWNQIPVTLGNLVGGFVFTGLALYTTYKPAKQAERMAPAAAQAGAE